MVLVPVTCPYCHSDQIIKGGKTETGKQRYHCQQTDWSHRSFVLNPAYKGRLPQIKEQVIDMALNNSGIRDTVRVLKISPTTVINELKKRVDLKLCQPLSSRPVKSGGGRSGDSAR